MKIQVIHTSQFVNDKVPWIFFGNSYLKMKYWEKRLLGNRINLQSEIHNQAEKQKRLFLKWIEDQRIANKDSINWWTKHIASRNNIVSNFFPYLCQLFAIQDYLKKNDQLESILIVCENYFLIKLLSENLPSKYKLQFPILLKIYWFNDSISLLIKGFLNQLNLIYFFAVNFFYAKLTKPKKIVKPDGDVILFHHILDNVNRFERNNIKCIYFTILPSWLRKQGKKVFGLPWLFKNKPTLSYYKNLRKTNCLIPEDWLNFKDYFNILKNYTKSLGNLRYDISYPDANLDYLVLHEKIAQLSETGVIFLRYIPAIQKWSKEIKSLTVYDQYYNFPFEHPIRYAIKKLPIKTKSIGFYDSLTSKEFMCHHHLESEWLSQVKPDHVVCSGKLGENILLSQGVPRKRLSSGAALRQLYLLNEASEKKISKQILILLSLVPEMCVEILSKMYSINSTIIELKLNVKVRIHPLMKVNYLLKKINWKNLPYGWEWTRGDLISELNDSYCCIAMDTSSIFDAILKKNIVIPLMSDLKIMENYLDIFSNKYPLTSSVPEKEIPNKLRDIFVSKKELYIDEFSKIRNELIKGINISNDNNLNSFIIDG